MRLIFFFTAPISRPRQATLRKRSRRFVDSRPAVWRPTSHGGPGRAYEIKESRVRDPVERSARLLYREARLATSQS